MWSVCFEFVAWPPAPPDDLLLPPTEQVEQFDAWRRMLAFLDQRAAN